MPNKDRSFHEAPQRAGGEGWLYSEQQQKLCHFKPDTATVHAQWVAIRTYSYVPPRQTIMDSAVTAQLGFCGYSDPVTLSTEFKKYGWQVTGSPKSSRAVGWQLMKSLLWQAGSEQPGLFISERCESLWATLPYCIADERNPEDMTKDAPDHSADAVRYVLTAANQGQHNYRASVKAGAHPLMWAEDRKRNRSVVYMGGRAVTDARRMSW